MIKKAFLMALLAFSSAVVLVPGAIATPVTPVLKPETPVEVSVTPKRFDLMALDTSGRRLIAAHSRAGTLTVVDVAYRKLKAEIPVGRSSGVAVDVPDGKYFVGTTRGIAVVDRSTLAKVDFIPTSGPTDAMVFDPHNDKLYVGHDDGKELWVVDARQDRIAGRIAIPGAPELMAVDPQAQRLYLNVKPLNEVIVIDTGSGRIVATWPAPHTDSPHGVALDLRDQRLFVAGHSPIVSVFSLPSGTPLKRVDIGPGHVDQIAFDAGAGRLYCPSSGRLAVVKVAGGPDTVLGSVRIPQGTHSVAVDPRTHRVWIAYADDQHSYVQAFVPPAAVSEAGSG